MAYGSGFPSPQWMETFESIHAAAELTNQRVQFLVDQNEGYIVSVAVDGHNACNRTGAIYVCPFTDAEVGSVICRDYDTMTHDGTKHRWSMRFKLVRKVERAEVEGLWLRCLQWPKPHLRDGVWFEALTD